MEMNPDKERPAWSRVQALGLCTALIGVVTVLGLPFRGVIEPTNVVMLYLLAVVVIALRLGRLPAIVASLLSVLLFDLVFVPPYYDLAVSDAQYLLTFGGLLTVGLLVSTLAAQLRERAARNAALYELSRDLADEAQAAHLLQETEKLQAALLNSISHDLRTPLASITGALSSLRDDSRLLNEGARRELVVTAHEEAERLNWLVANLLKMTQLESGALQIALEAHDIEDVVGVALAQLSSRLQGRQVEVAIGHDLPLALMDFVPMTQVFVNLLENAHKYSPAGRPICIRASATEDALTVAVLDRGPGIPPEALERIFDKFYRLRGADSDGVGGTGLGLSISRGIVEAHGGRIWAENRAEGGSAFFVTLPLSKRETEA